MKLNLFKPAIAMLAVILTAVSPCFAQVITAQADSDAIIAPVQPAQPAFISHVVVQPNPLVISAKVNTKALKVTLDKLETQLKNLDIKANVQLAVKNLAIANVSLKAPVPTVGVGYMENDNIETNTNNGDGVSQVKNYSKVYPADGGDQLAIDNRYGDIVVNTWDKNQFKVDVQIKVDAASDDDAQKVLDNVSISDSKDGSTVAFKTDIGSVGSSWLSWLTGDHKGQGHRLKISYTVYMPAKNELAINNSYGAVTLPELNAKVAVNVAYGSLSAKSLNNESTIRASYSNVDLGTLDATWIDISYGNLTVGSVNRIWSNASYSGIKVDKIRESGAFNIRYAGSFSIGDLDRSVNDLAINASYSNLAIGLSGDENANFNISLRYGEFDYGNHTITFTDKPADDGKPHNEKSYKGAFGRGGSGKNIAINSSYGNVTFN